MSLDKMVHVSFVARCDVRTRDGQVVKPDLAAWVAWREAGYPSEPEAPTWVALGRPCLRRSDVVDHKTSSGARAALRAQGWSFKTWRGNPTMAACPDHKEEDLCQRF